MKRLLSLLVVFGLWATISQAQQTSDNLFLQQVSQEEGYGPHFVTGEDFFSFYSNIPFISNLQQAAMEANQVARVSVVGDENITELSQTGMGNIGAININGSNNKTSLEQNGTGLFSILNIQGSSNNLNLDQVGSALQNYVQVTGFGIDFDIRQDNSGIELIQNGGTSIPLSIQQTGRSVPIIITNN